MRWCSLPRLSSRTVISEPALLRGAVCRDWSVGNRTARPNGAKVSIRLRTEVLALCDCDGRKARKWIRNRSSDARGYGSGGGAGVGDFGAGAEAEAFEEDLAEGHDAGVEVAPHE